MLKGPRRSFVVVVVDLDLVGVESKAKMFTVEQKMFLMEQKPFEFFTDPWPLHGVSWPFMAKYRFGWTCIVFSRSHRSKFIWSCFIRPLCLSIMPFSIRILNTDHKIVENSWLMLTVLKQSSFKEKTRLIPFKLVAV